MRSTFVDQSGGRWAALLLAGLGLAACGDRRGDTGPARPPAQASAPASQAAARPAQAVVTSTPRRPPELLTLSQALLIPVAGVRAEMLRDDYHQVRGSGRHEALDIMAPRGTPVLAVADGRVAKLFTSKPGGLTVYQFDATGQLIYYYAHLDSYAPDLLEGMAVRRGQQIGTVGSTGNASGDAPHLHFAIFVLGPERQWWKGTPTNPYPLFAAR